MYVYIKSKPNLWTVGFYDPTGEFQPESDHTSKDEAAARVHYLNGGELKPKDACVVVKQTTTEYGVLTVYSHHYHIPAKPEYRSLPGMSFTPQSEWDKQQADEDYEAEFYEVVYFDDESGWVVLGFAGGDTIYSNDSCGQDAVKAFTDFFRIVNNGGVDSE